MKFSEYVYERPNIEKVKEEYEKLISEFEKAESSEMQNETMKKINTLVRKFSTMQTLASVRHSIDTTDEFYENEKKFYDEVGPVLQGYGVKYYKALDNSKFKDELIKKWGQRLFDIARLEMKTYSDEVVEELKKENELVSAYNKITSSAKIMFKGEERNLSGMTPFMQDIDRKTRKEAAVAMWGFFSENEAELDRIYDEMVKVRTSIAKKLGYKNFVQLGYDRLGRADYNSEMVAKYRDQVHKYIVPMCVKLRKRQAERIGLDSLKVYDTPLKFVSGNAKPKGNAEFMVENAHQMYSEMSAETKEFFDMMVQNGLMDLESKKGKRPGGYCTFFSDYKVPFIFSNFNGTSHDVDVLTHEAGHAFQMYSSRNFELPEYMFPTLEACEIHSMSMEFFAWPWIDKFFKEETEKYKFTHISESILFLPYGVSVDEFQHFVYENPEATPAERKAMWKKISAKYTPDVDGDGIDYVEKGGAWQKQLHIYNVPFYYIDYTLAQVCALQYWKMDRENHEKAWESYVKLCKLGGSKSFVELVNSAGLKLPFNEGCLESVTGEIEKWLDSVEDKKL